MKFPSAMLQSRGNVFTTRGTQISHSPSPDCEKLLFLFHSLPLSLRFEKQAFKQSSLRAKKHFIQLLSTQ